LRVVPLSTLTVMVARMMFFAAFALDCYMLDVGWSGECGYGVWRVRLRVVEVKYIMFDGDGE
jgi:hypothetical protein